MSHLRSIISSEKGPIEEHLHVIAVISNAVPYLRRYVLFRQFMDRMEKEKNVILYVVELAYGDQKFVMTSQTNPRHLQLRTETPLWHKENLINLGVQKLLPSNYKAFAWIDGDIEFENHTWASDTLLLLNHYNIVQLFSHSIDMDRQMNIMSIATSVGYQYEKGKRLYINNGNWHPGYAWAITREFYEKLGGLYDKSILGSGDSFMLWSMFQISEQMYHPNIDEKYKQSILDYQKNMASSAGLSSGETVTISYTPGMIRHYFHGSKENRKYMERHELMATHKFQPSYITYDENGVIVPTHLFPDDFKNDIMTYFKERNEDEYFLERKE